MKYKNNPLNIRYSALNHWIGQSGEKNGFCEFDDLEFGLRAGLILLMRSYRKKGLVTYQQLIERFAPPSENPTYNYVDFVCSHMGKFPFDIPYKDIHFCAMVYYMARFEQGKDPEFNMLDVMKVMKVYNIKIYFKK